MLKEVFESKMTNEEVIERYAELVMTLANANVTLPSDAEDVFQEVFLRYIDKKPAFRDEDHAQAWFIKVTMNLIRSMYRKHEYAKRTDIEDGAVDWEQSARTLTGERVLDERFAELMDSDIDFGDVMAQMKPDYKAVLMLQYDCGYTVRETARILGKSEASVKGLTARAKQQFVELVTKGEGRA